MVSSLKAIVDGHNQLIHFSLRRSSSCTQGQQSKWCGRLTRIPAVNRRNFQRVVPTLALQKTRHFPRALEASVEVLQYLVDDSDAELPTEKDVHAISSLHLSELLAAADGIRNKRLDSRIVTFSPKVFIPVTKLCRDTCGYCTFAESPEAGKRAYMTEEEVLEVARKGAEAGCTEALFTLGDKPELRYDEARNELAHLGFPSTLSYVAHLASLVSRHTSLLPHINAGVMSAADLALLRCCSASQGLMLESSAPHLMLPGGAHYNCPDKDPDARLATIAEAGRLHIPFTSGLLIGIGEQRSDRIRDLLSLRALHQQYGHIQEVIIQPFRAKAGTRMAVVESTDAEELLWTCAMARIIFGPHMSIQSPPNLSASPVEQLALLAAGINDWGGISPLTPDFVNPEAPWPHILQLADVTASAGYHLVPRLPVYPKYISLDEKDTWMDPFILPLSLSLSDSHGFARCQSWSPGADTPIPIVPPLTPSLLSDSSRGQLERQQAAADALHHSVDVEGEEWLKGGSINSSSSSSSSSSDDSISSSNSSSSSSTSSNRKHSANHADPVNGSSSSMVSRLEVGANGLLLGDRAGDRAPVSSKIQDALDRIRGGEKEPQEDDVALLLSARGSDFAAICSAADALRQQVNGEEVTYVVNRNINYTNVCTYGCQFCAFSKGKASDGLRGSPYLMDLEEISRRVSEAWERGATEVCMQGGIHPDFTGSTYIDILRAAKSAAPLIHVHAFSPLEVMHGASSLGMSVSDFLSVLRKEGLGSLPGTAAEVLHDGVREQLCPDKLSSQQWLEVVEAAHRVGLRTTSTLMFGHIDHPRHWAHHLLLLRSLQQRTGGITEFVPLPFVHMTAPMFLKGQSRRGPSFHECVLLHAVARLVLHPHITNIQASWVKMGPGGAAALLAVGCNDFGGCLMNESITRAAGAIHGQEMTPPIIEATIRSVGRVPRQRSTLYEAPPNGQVLRSLQYPYHEVGMAI